MRVQTHTCTSDEDNGTGSDNHEQSASESDSSEEEIAIDKRVKIILMSTKCATPLLTNCQTM